MTKGVRFIGGREYLLAGRTTSRERAEQERTALQNTWQSVQIVKLCDWDFMLYVHALKIAA